ncbi:hypothetical protein ACOSQ2_029335 [Xanthoceras sorbifolium]
MTKKGGGGGGSKQACAACKHQRRRCADNCPLAPYFPADQHQNFLNAHRLFGIGNIMRVLRQVPEDQRQDAVKSIIFESNQRALNPVVGCWGVVLQFRRQFQAAVEELHKVNAQLAVFRNQVPSRDLDLGIVRTNSIALPVPGCDYQNPAVQGEFKESTKKLEQQYYFDNPVFFSQGIPTHQPGSFASENIPVEPPFLPVQIPSLVSEGIPVQLPLLVSEGIPVQLPLLVSEGIPVQPPLLISEGMPIFKGNHDHLMHMVADHRKPYPGSKGAYCVDKSLDRIAGDTKSGLKRAYHVDKSLDIIAGDTKPYPPYLRSKRAYHVDKSSGSLTDEIKPSTESKGACEPRNELLHIESKTGEKENDKGQQGYDSELIKALNGGNDLHTKAEDS